MQRLEERCLLSISIAIDFSDDTNHFFDDPGRRYLVQLAADVVASALSNDHLAAIAPAGADNWTATFPNPSTGAPLSIANLTVPADTILIYVGGRPLSSASSGEAGLGSTGGFSATGDPGWLDDVAARGHGGALAASPSSFGPWGGSIAFDDGSTRWFFGSSEAGLTSSETDFFAVAEHEIGHVLGLGTSPSWFSHVAGGVFDGPAAMAVHGGPVPLSPDHAHWADGVTSDGVDAVMDPVLYDGSRSMFTDLDYAGLADVGWSVTPPSRGATVQFSTPRYTALEDGGTATITVNRTGGLGAFTVHYATGGGSAPAVAGTLSFGIADPSETFNVPVVDDPRSQVNPSITLRLSDPGAGVSLGAQSTAGLTIIQGRSNPPDDFDGDGRTDYGVFRPSTAQWFIAPTGNGPMGPISFGAGNLTDIPVPADYDRVGHTEPAVFRPTTGQWFIAGHAQPISFGASDLTDVPVPADYEGLGYDQPAVFRPSTAQWFIAGQAQPINFGAPNLTDIPVPADYDGNGHAVPAVFRPSTGQWFIAGQAQPISFGATNLTDIPVPGDYDGLGHAELAVFRPSTGQWFIAGHAQPISFGATNFFDLPLNTSIGSLRKLGLIGGQSPSVSASSAASGMASAAVMTAPTTSTSTSGITTLPVAPATTPDVVADTPAHRRHHHPRPAWRRAR